MSANLPAVRTAGAIPLAAKRVPDEFDEPGAEALALAREAADRCSLIVTAFFWVLPHALFKSTRGAAREAFPRQVLMAGLVSELGLAPLIVGRAVGRDKATVEHAGRVIEALRGGMASGDLIRSRDNPKAVLTQDDVNEFFGGVDGLEAFLEHGERILDEIFAAFRLVAVVGAAYCREIAKLERERAEQRAAYMEAK